MNSPSIILGGGVHGKVCWLIAYLALTKINNNKKKYIDNTEMPARDVRYIHSLPV